MKSILILALLGILGVAHLSYSQDIPDAVKEYMRQLQNDSTVENGFDYAKMQRYIDQNDQFQDWFVGLPIQFYELAMDFEKTTEDTKFEEIIKPTNKWLIPIKTKSAGWIYHVLVTVDGNRYTPYGCGQGVPRGWDDIRKKFPEKTGVIPGFIEYPWMLFYFPHIKDGKNIFHAKIPNVDGILSTKTSKSLDNLDDGKTIISLLKEQMKEYRKAGAIVNDPSNSKNTSGDSK